MLRFKYCYKKKIYIFNPRVPSQFILCFVHMNVPDCHALPFKIFYFQANTCPKVLEPTLIPIWQPNDQKVSNTIACNSCQAFPFIYSPSAKSECGKYPKVCACFQVSTAKYLKTSLFCDIRNNLLHSITQQFI